MGKKRYGLMSEKAVEFSLFFWTSVFYGLLLFFWASDMRERFYAEISMKFQEISLEGCDTACTLDLSFQIFSEIVLSFLFVIAFFVFIFLLCLSFRVLVRKEHLKEAITIW